MAQHAGISASAASLPSVPPGQSADQPSKPASQAAHTIDAVGRRHHQPSSQVPATAAQAQMLGRRPWHGPCLPERPQKRKHAAIESCADLGQTHGLCSVRRSPALVGKHRSKESVLVRETNLQTPDLGHTVNTEQQRLTVPVNPCKTRESLLASSPFKAATIKVKLEPTSSQSTLFDLQEASRASGLQSSAAALLPCQGSITTQAPAARQGPNHHQMVEAELPVPSKASAPMTEVTAGSEPV